MKKILISLFFLASIALILVAFVLVAPYYLFNEVMQGRMYSSWYAIEKYSSQYLSARPFKQNLDVVLNTHDFNNDLFRPYQLSDLLVPLPHKNPFFIIRPEFLSDDLYLIHLNSPGGLNLNKIYVEPIKRITFKKTGQKIFELPWSRNILESYTAEQIWNDLFTLELGDWAISYDKMIYHLYILHLRSLYLNDEVVNFGLIDDQRAILEYSSFNKDYKEERVLTKKGGILYSYLLKTRREVPKAKEMRQYFLNKIKFVPSSSSFAKSYLVEYQALDFEARNTYEALMLLYAAITHAPRERLYYKEFIRVAENLFGEDQMQQYYNLAYKLFSETFSTKEAKKINSEVDLRRNIELERRRVEEMKMKKALEQSSRPIQPKEKTKDEILIESLNKAKAKAQQDQVKDEIILD